ncbi:MAG TPA: hypothetical protein VJT74_04975 [Pyrinomonadaceae bacterium]|nr:hypothetical protein [Pyrinomonadaceae bacterium]
MRRRAEYRAKVTDDSGLKRGRVPCPLLQDMRARPGNYLTFRLADSGEVVMRLTRPRKRAIKPSKRR